MPLRGSPFCCAKGATPVAQQSRFHGVRWYGLLHGLRTSEDVQRYARWPKSSGSPT